MTTTHRLTPAQRTALEAIERNKPARISAETCAGIRARTWSGFNRRGYVAKGADGRWQASPAGLAALARS